MLSDVDRMDNFLKTYMPAGGEVSLSWSRIKTALVELGTTPNTGSPKKAAQKGTSAEKPYTAKKQDSTNVPGENY